MAELKFDGPEITVAVRVIRSARRRRTISFGVVDGAVVVRAPLRTSRAEIVALLTRRQAWIAGRLAREAASEGPSRFVPGSALPYLGRELSLSVCEAAGRRARVSREDGELRVVVPAGLEDGPRDQVVRNALVAWYRSRAADVFTEIVDAWSEVSGLAAKQVFVRAQKRRWGSCGPDGTIRLNWRLVMAEPEVIEYVVVHELAHLRHRHHQAAFWAEVAAMLPGHAALRKRLLEFGRSAPRFD